MNTPPLNTQSETRTTSSMFLKNALKFSFIGCLISITFCILLIVFSLGLLLGSQTTREWLVQDITPKILSSNSTQLTINGFSSPRLGTWSFYSISYTLNDKILFDASSLLLKFAPLMLFDKKLDVIELSANKLVIDIPESNASDISNVNESASLNWQDYLVPIRLQKVDFNHIDISVPKLKIPTLQVRGASSIFWGNALFQSDLIIQTRSQKEALINLQADIDAHFSGLLKAQIQEDAGGWIGALINLPSEQAADFNLQLSASPGDEAVNFDLQSFNMPWQVHNISALGQGSWLSNEHKLLISKLDIFVDGKQQGINGWWQAEAFEINAALNKLPISLSASFQDYITGGDITGTVSASGSFSNPTIKTNISTQTHYNKKSATLSLKGEGNFDTFNIDHAVVNLADAMAETSGSLFLNKQELDLQIHKLSGPVRVIEIFDVEFIDNLAIDIKNAYGSLKGPFTSPEYSGFTQAIGQYKAQNFKVQSDFIGDINKVTISNALATISGSELKADGLIDWYNEKLDLKLQTDKLPLDLIQLVDVQLPPSLIAHINSAIKVRGSFNQPIFDGTASVKGLFNHQSFNIKTGLKADKNKVQLNDLIATLETGHLTSKGLVDWNNEHLDIVIDAQHIPLSILTLIPLEIPSELVGNINAKGSIQGQFYSPSFNGHTSANIDFKHAHYEIESELDASPEQVQIKSFSSLLTLADSSTTPHKASASGSGRYKIATKELDGKLTIDALPYQVVELFGIQLPPNLEGKIDTNLKLSGQLPIPTLQGDMKSEGVFEGESFNFNFVGSQADQTLRFDNTNIQWRTTILSANGLLSRDNLDLHLNLQDLKIADLNKFGFDLKPGSLDISLNLLGSVASPKLDGLVTLTVDKQIHPDDMNAPLEDIVVTTSLKTENKLLVINSDVMHGQTDKGKLQIESTFIPVLNWFLDETKTQKLADIPVNINASGHVGLNWINNFIDRDIQSISGELRLNTQLHGSLNSPRIKGALALTNGQYVNSLSQTSIENAEIELAFDEKSISITKAQASDGQKGTLKLSGNASLADNDDGNIDVTLSLNKASLVRREDIEGDATGSIKLSGSLKEILVSGDVDVSPFQIMLDLIPTESIPEIEVSLKEDSRQPSKNKIIAPPILLNINVGVEQQAYIRGRGLDAELKGRLSLSGTSKKPNYNGQFTVVRGTFELFAKTFKLEEGDVLFSNNAVSLFVQGRHTGKDITFIASLSGTLDNLKIALTTEPVLPEDEALARLLFGKSVRNITPIQAIQLASAIQTLRGEGSGFDPLGKARELFHVDTISVESQETSEGNGLAVGVGKYITEGVYVELTRTPDPAQPWKGSVEVELTPSINLETTTGSSSGFGGVELQWKKDY